MAATTHTYPASPAASFPSDAVDPRLKEQAPWLLAYARAAWAEWLSVRSALDLTPERLEVIRSYALGTQSTAHVRDQVGIGERQFRPGARQATAAEDWLKIDSRPLAIYPKVRTIALRRVTGEGYRPRVSPLDIQAASEREEHLAELRKRMRLRAEIEAIDPSVVDDSPVAPKPGEPLDEGDLEIYARYGYRHAAGIEMETLLRAVHQDSQLDEDLAGLRRDLIDFGIGVMRERADERGVIRADHVPLERAVIDFGERRDFADARYCGEVRYLSVAELRLEAGDVLAPEQITRAAHASAGMYGNPKRIAGDISGVRVAVLDLEVATTDELAFYTGRNRRGNPVVARTKPTDKRGAVERRFVRAIYRVTHVVNTDAVYDYGRAYDQKRARGNMGDTRMSYVVRCVERQARTISSIGRRVIPVIDSLQVTWAKFQQARAVLQSAGYAIDVVALQDIALGDGEQTVPVDSLLDLFFQRNVTLFKRYNVEGDVSGVPIQSVPGSGFQEMGALFAQVQADINMLRLVTGLNEFTDGSTPGERSLTTVARMAAESTNNALEDLRDAEFAIVADLNREIIRRAQSLARHGRFDYYARALGDDTLAFWSDHAGVAFGEFAVEVEMLPTAEQRQRLLEMATQKHLQGLVTLDDLYLIENTDNLKQAQAMLAHRTERRRQRLRAEQVEQEGASAQLAAAAQQQKVELEREMAEFKFELDQRAKEAEFERKVRLTVLEGEIKKEIASLHTASGERREQIKEAAENERTHAKASVDVYRADVDAAVKAALAGAKADNTTTQAK